MNSFGWFLLGYSVCATVVIIILAKRPTTHNEIDNLKQKNKRNKGSSIDNDISAELKDKIKKRRLRKLLTKKRKDEN